MALRSRSTLWLLALGLAACTREQPKQGESPEAAPPPPSAVAPPSAVVAPAVSGPAVASADVADEAPCPPRFGEKRGVSFIALCSADKDPLWISAEPVGCAGSDAGVCPETLALAPPTGKEIRARATSIAEVASARAECSTRFGGRLPTRAERASASHRLGIATLLVAQLPKPAQGFRFEALREWVSESACESASADCRTGSFPAAAPGWDLPWSAARSCDARPAKDAATEAGVTLGHVCTADGFVWTTGSSTVPGPRILPCALRASPTALFDLTCRPPAEADAAAPPSSDTVAAFRCVVPESTLTKLGPKGPAAQTKKK